MDAFTIIVGLVTSGLGMAYVQFGRKQARIPTILAGVGLLLYIYVIDNHFWQITIGVALAAVPFIFRF